ncbi:MAG: RNA polymerase sigma factor RpoE [Calditrichia bacterium]
MEPEKFYKDNIQKIFNLLIYMVGDKEIAKDLAHDAFVQFFKNVENFKGDAAPATYLYRIAINLGINYQKKKKRVKNIFTQVEDDNLSQLNVEKNTPEQQIIKNEFWIHVRKILLELPEKQARTFYLSKIAGYAQKDISNMLGMSVSAVESNVFRAKKVIAQKLHQIYGENLSAKMSNISNRGQTNEK